MSTPVTRPDLDALIARLTRDMSVPGALSIRAEAFGDIRQVIAALAAERARADQAAPREQYDELASLVEMAIVDTVPRRQFEEQVRLVARMDEAVKLAGQRIADAPHDAEKCELVLYPEVGLYPGGDSACTCWKSAAPTAEAIS